MSFHDINAILAGSALLVAAGKAGGHEPTALARIHQEGARGYTRKENVMTTSFSNQKASPDGAVRVVPGTDNRE